MPTRTAARGALAPTLAETLEPRVMFDVTPSSPDYPVVELQTNFGSIFMEMYTDTAPATVANFLGYVNRGDYDGSFFHRMVVDQVPGLSANDFVLQGGGFAYDDDGDYFFTPSSVLPNGIRGYREVPDQAPVVNEFERSNLQWTVAMAKLGGDPDSATNQFFFNLNDNSANLDNQNGGFTVFASVIEGRDVVAAIVSQPVQNLGSDLFGQVPVTDHLLPTATDLVAEDFVSITDARVLYMPDTGLTPTQSVPVGAATDSSSRATFAAPNVDGGVLNYEQTLDGTWNVSELGLKTDLYLTATQSVSFNNNGQSQVLAAGSDAVWLFTQDESGAWSRRNLTTEVTGAELLAGSLTAFISTDGLAYVAGVAADGDVMLYAQTLQSGDNGVVWRAENLSDTLRGRGLTPPVYAGELTSYVTSWNGLNIGGLDANGDIQTVWWAPGLPAWTTNNLSDLTGAPALAGGLKPYLTSWGGINLAGADATGDLTTTWWVPGGAWQTFNFTESLDGPQLDPASTTTYVTSWDGLNIVGLDADGNLTVYWWAPGLESWRITDLSSIVEGDTPPAGPVTGVTSSLGRTSVAGVTADGDLVRYTWAPGGQWTFENITDTASFV